MFFYLNTKILLKYSNNKINKYDVTFGIWIESKLNLPLKSILTQKFYRVILLFFIFITMKMVW